MVQLALVMIAATGVGNQTLEYEAAFTKAQKENKPLVILVGASWCASCQIMKRETIEPMHQAGRLDDVVLTFVDKDERPELAEQLMKGETLPQIVVYAKKTGSCKRYSLSGMQSENRMTELIGRAMDLPNRTLR